MPKVGEFLRRPARSISNAIDNAIVNRQFNAYKRKHRHDFYVERDGIHMGEAPGSMMDALDLGLLPRRLTRRLRRRIGEE